MSFLATQLLGVSNFGSPSGVTQQSKQVLMLWHLTYYIAIPLGLIVIGSIAWSVVRYRIRPGDDRQPEQFQYHIPIEATYTIVPIVLVAIVFGFLYHAENVVNHVSKRPALLVKVQAFQWGWRFTYPNGHQEIGDVAEEPNINAITTLPVLRLPEHETVQLQLTSADVTHSFYVPQFLFQRDIIPGITQNVDFNINRTGTWLGECTNICGTYHAYMKFRVQAMTPAAYQAWYSHQAPNSVTNSGKSVVKYNQYSNPTGANG